MTEITNKRLSQIARELNVGLTHLADFLQKKGYEVNAIPNAKVSLECYQLLLDQFSTDKFVKQKSEELKKQKEALLRDVKESKSQKTDDDSGENDKNDQSEAINQKTVSEKEEKIEETKIETVKEIVEEKETKKTDKLKIIGKIDLDKKNAPEKIQSEKNTDIAEKKVEAEKIPEEKIEIEKTSISEEKKEIIKAEKQEDKIEKQENIQVQEQKIEKKEENQENEIKVLGKINLDTLNQKTRPDRKSSRAERRKERRDREQASKDALEKAKNERQQKDENEKTKLAEKKIEADKPKKNVEDFIATKVQKLIGPTVVGKINLEEKTTPKEKAQKAAAENQKRKRKRHKRVKKVENTNAPAAKPKINPKIKKAPKAEISEEDVKNQVRETLAKLTDKRKKTAVKYRKVKRDEVREKIQEEINRQELEERVLKVTEFISANELATLMNISVNSVISICFELGKMVTINSRLDAELISIVAEENNFQVEFIDLTENEEIDSYVESDENLIRRPPIVTVMGHVDHGKTSLLDFIRHTNVIAGEAGGITQHIGAYKVMLETGEQITFLDTPGHEAFTAMRARGAKVTDLAIIIVAADDSIMPQTEEAIAHAKAAGVPIIFAINKIDKPGANPEKIKEALAAKNMLVESWGGKYQSTDISAKQGINIDKLLEEVVLAAEMLELKANPNRPAKGTIIEAQLDKGRGFISTVLVETGTLRVGDILLAGAYSGKVKALFNERNHKVESAGPSEPVLVLGLDGAPQAGDLFYVMPSEKEARDIANKNKRLHREQSLRAHKHITLDEIGRRLKLGNFKELNVIIKGDVTGSIEAMADSFIKLGNEEIVVNVIHKAVGQISEADVMLAAASNAIIIGFQVRPSLAAKRIAENEEIEMRLYSVIYDAINELKSAMEGMLSPEIKEEITATIEIREVFKITKVGKIAGCMVLDGKVQRDNKIRLIRDGIIIYSGVLGSLKRYKDDAKEVVSGQECGLNIENYQDIKEGDIVEAYKEREVAKKL